jgi:hypothetical protein
VLSNKIKPQNIVEAKWPDGLEDADHIEKNSKAFKGYIILIEGLITEQI